MAIPTFALYGEDDWPSPAGFAHIETIAARSVLHDWAIAPHRHDRAVQLLLVHAGPAEVTLDGIVFALTGPAFIIVPTGVVHGFRFEPHTVGHVLTLTQDFASRAQTSRDPLAALLAHGGHGALGPDAAARANRLAGELIALGDGLAQGGGIDDPLFDALAEALLRSLVATAGVPRSDGDQRLAVFRHLVETHLAEHRSLPFYAHSVGTTVRTLTRLSQRHLGHSPQMLINRRLALEAQRLLRFTGASASAVASELGFADPSYFSRFYLRMTGHRPHDERPHGERPHGEKPHD